MKIRFITTLLTALLTLSVLQAQEFEFTYKGQTLKYIVTAEKEASVKKADVELSGDVAIPSEITFEKKKYKVTSIGHEAFVGCGNIKSVVIPNTVTSIGTEAFAWSNIHVVIPSTVMSIGGGAFYGVKSFRTFDFTYEGETLRYEVIAESEVWVASRGEEESYNISGELKIPSEVEFESKKYKVTRIGQWAFRDCSNLQSVVIPNSVMSIGHEAFVGCGLQNIVLPSSVKSIGALAFLWNTNLQSIGIPNSVTTIEVGAFHGCTNLQDIVIPNSVKTIGTQAFHGCTNLQRVSISESVANFDSLAFKQCPNLSKIEASPNNKRYSSKDGALYSKSGDTLFFVPEKTAAFSIPKTVKHIGVGAFAFCDSLRSITLPNSVISIENSAFVNCHNLQSVVIPNSVKRIGKAAFGVCRNLQSVNIPNSVTSIGEEAFARCESLQSIVIPNSVTRIENGTFYGCRHLGNITIPNSVKHIGNGAFNGCGNLSDIVVPNSVTSIGEYAFADVRLRTLIVEAQTPPAIGTAVFESMYGNAVPAIYVPAASVEKYKAAEGWKEYADKIQPIK
jgi:hypothetical protein